MEGFFGIGFGELVMIAIVALIVLGPERLPSALREVAKFIRQLRNLSREFTDQFGDEFKALEDLNPRRILQDAITSLDEEEKAKEEPKTAKKSTTTSSPPKTTAPKPTTTKSTTTTAKPATTTSPKATTPKAADSSKTVARETAPLATTTTESLAADSSVTAITDAKPVDDLVENRIAPPPVETAVTATPARTNGHHPEPNPVADTPAAADTPSEPMVDSSVVVSPQVDGEGTKEG